MSLSRLESKERQSENEKEKKQEIQKREMPQKAETNSLRDLLKDVMAGNEKEKEKELPKETEKAQFTPEHKNTEQKEIGTKTKIKESDEEKKRAIKPGEAIMF